PDVGIITSMDADHLDIYGNEIEMIETYNNFAQKVKKVLIYKKNLPIGNTKDNQKIYALSNNCDYSATEIYIKDHQYNFTWENHEISIPNLKMQMEGRHNVENAVASIAVARELKIQQSKIEEAIFSYSGVKR